MTKAAASLSRVLNWKPSFAQRIALMAWILVAIAVLGGVHYMTGPQYEFHAFYLLPVIVASWYGGGILGALTAFAGAGNWLAMEWLTPGMASRPTMTIVINELVRLTVFLVVSFLTSKLRFVLHREASLARIDPLTALANRRLFYEEGAAELKRAQRGERPLTVMFLDLDDFKEVNDRQGHHAGDALLREVANTLRNSTRGSDIVGRLGGDEFGVIMPETGRNAAHASAAKLHEQLLCDMQKHGWPVTVSIGVATFIVPPQDIDELIAQADTLMYAVKRIGKNTIRHETFN